jgi:hypothetical protein
MNDKIPPTLPKGPEPTQAHPERKPAPRILMGCGIAVAVILALAVGSVVFFFATARKGHDMTMAEYTGFFKAHRDCFHRLAELEDAGEDPTAAPCVKELDAVSIRSKPLTVTMYLFFTADFRSFVYLPDNPPESLVENLDEARKETPSGGSAYASMGDGWYLRYTWD